MFIILPVGMNYQTQRLPVVTFTLMGINTLVYLVSLVFWFAQGSDSEVWIFEHLWLIPAMSGWHAYLTSMFVHGDIFHLLGNMMYLFLFGCCVEDLVGRWRFLSFYLLGGFVAELVHIAAMPDHFASELPMGGASGAISACMGGYLVLRAGAEIDFKYFGWMFFRIFAGEFSLAAWIVIIFWFLKDVFFAALSYFTESGQGGVAFGAHVGGFLAGLSLVGLNRLVTKNAPEEAAAKAGPIRVRVSARPRAAAPAAAPVAAEVEAAPATIYLYDGSSQLGPFNAYQIQQMLTLGSVTAETLYWSEGMTEWRSVSELAS